MNKSIRIEVLKCAIMTVESERQMHKKSRMELECAIMTIENNSKICKMHKNRSTQIRNDDR